MRDVTLTIDGTEIRVPAGTTILEAAGRLSIYIPTLCNHPDLPPAERSEPATLVFQGGFRLENARPGEKAKGCGLCVVELEGENDLVNSCDTEAREGMAVITDNERVRDKRRENLMPVLARHPHSCLTCAQREGCSRASCSSGVPESERCCPKFGNCEFQRLAEYVGILPSTPGWILPGLPVLGDGPLFAVDYNLCIGCTRCVRACADLRGVRALGFVFDGDGQVRVGTLRPTLEESGCRFCLACVEVCPAGAIADKAVRKGKSKEDPVPCREACPVRMDVPAYIRLIAQGRRDEADAVIREKVPLPGVLGRVCTHPCEAVCRRGEINEAVSICALKRYATDGDGRLWRHRSRQAPDTGRRVAVVGAGPAGLTAAFYLRKKGHSVTLFESREEAGGMLRYGIPSHRLPREILDAEIRDILDTGIAFRPGSTLGTDFSLDELLSDGHEAVFVAVGAQLSRGIPLEGAESPDVLQGLDFLKDVAGGRQVPVGDRVIVVGGGGVAVDAALTVLRLGAKEATIVCLERRGEMPANEWEIRSAAIEGVRLMPSWGPSRVIGEKGRVTGLEIVHCARVWDDQGNFHPALDGTREILEGDQVILACGQTVDASFIGEGCPVVVDRRLIQVDPETLESGLKGVYAGGDAASAERAVIHAVAAGRRAAVSIDNALGGNGAIEEVLFQRGDPGPYLGREEGFAGRRREVVPEAPPETRRGNFDEIALGYSEDQALREAGRCLQCDLRLLLREVRCPPGKRLAFTEENVRRSPEAEGVYRLYAADGGVLAIKGTHRLRQDLQGELEGNETAVFFDYEEAKMYSARESELIQQYVRQHGEMPGSGDPALDELF